MKQDPFEKYMLKKNIGKKQQVQLQLSDSSSCKKQKDGKPRIRQLKINQLFNNRVKNKPENQSRSLSNNNQRNIRVTIAQPRFKSSTAPKNQQIDKFPDAKKQIWESIMKEQAKIRAQIKAQKQISVPIYIKNQKRNNNYQLQMEARNRQKQQERKLKKQKKREQQKKKHQQIIKKRNLTFRSFLSSITDRSQKNQQNQKQVKNSEGQLQNIALFNKMQQENLQKVMQAQGRRASKANVGLTYKKIKVQRQKIPISFLKMLFSYKFSPNFPNQQSKKVPNSFSDQMMYKKIFHYLVVNQCISDIHLRLEKIQQNSDPSIPIVISGFKTNSDGFIQFTINQFQKQLNKEKSTPQKQKFMVKNLSLSRNRLGLITNSKHFKLDQYGIPCQKNDRVFGFLCLLVTPQSKQELNSQVKGLTSIQIDSLQLIFKLNKTNKCFFHDLEKLSTHIRQYLAVSYLYDTEVAPFIYNPQLIEKHHLQLIQQQQREQLQPILQKLKTQYNNTQYESIRQMALRASGFVLLQGPPGTGKTTTLMGLLAAQYEYQKKVCRSDQKRKIMICAPSNAAIDHITKRLVCQGLISTSSQSMNFSIDGSNSQKHFQNPNQRVFPKVLRVGIVETDDKIIQSVSLDHICDLQMIKAKQSNIKRNNMTTLDIKQKMYSISKQINRLKTRKDLQQWQKQEKATSYKFQLKRYQNLLFNFRKQKIVYKQTYNQIQKKQIQQAEIILSTLSSSGSDKLDQIRGFIGCLIIDEAAQATEPNILIPLQTGVRKVLLIGDPCQLPSTTMSQDSSITLFNRSLFERFLDNGIKPYFLNIQYRMAPLIRQFPSSAFYDNRLLDAQSVISRYQQAVKINQNPIKQISHFFNRNSIFIDVKFGQEQFHGNSYKNIGECIVLKSFIMNFIKKTNLSIGVITPYQAQKKHLLKQLKKQISQIQSLTKELQKYNQLNKQKEPTQELGNQQNSGVCVEEGQVQNNNQMKDENQQKMQEQTNKQKKSQNKLQIQSPSQTLQQLIQGRVMINTVDSFQGQEKDIIIVSTVRSNSRKDIGFMKDQRRINVALTRSRHLLIVIGNADTIGSNQIWNKYLEWSQKNKCLHQIREREDVKSAIQKINKGFNQDKVDRIRHKKLSKDIRKIERQQIRRQDFGLQTNKKVKKQKTYTPRVNNEPKQQKTSQKINNNSEIKTNTLTPQQIDQKRAEELLEQKRAKEQEAYTLQQVNRRIKQLQQKMKLDGNNLYAQLFEQ